MPKRVVIARVSQAAFLITSAILVAIGAGVCGKLRKCEHEALNPNSLTTCISVRFSIDTWHYANNEYIFGQYYVVSSTIVLLIVTIGVIVSPCDCSKRVGVITYGIRIAVCLCNGLLEAWYTIEGFRFLFGPGIFSDQVTKYIQMIFGESTENVDVFHFHIQSWAAASAMYFILAILYALEAVLAYTEDQMTNDQEILYQQMLRPRKMGFQSMG